ncbi:META domain-containing protein [Pontibacter sp. 172403-2]|uniref:META domain-containing protein n=1 Tax=Pontibacter rufus TaxID=2791028 RepID=UPI0018B00611|nr:META domain-containing protein [Pontibacter sp. 172403-2]MBF9252739.1 META domain-containing protein [Pontibacter sp. 172403-2]
MSISKFIAGACLLLALFVSACTIKPKDKSSEVYTFKDAYWMLMSIEGQSPQAPNNTHTAYIRFEENENDVHGFTGCNKFFGKYEGNEEQQTLKLSQLGATKMMCPNIELENKLMRVLENVDSYRISDDVLTLYAGGEAVATFMAGTERSIDNEVEDGLH